MKTFWRVTLLVLLQTALFNANAGERIALIIGNATYSQLGTLANPVKDATQVEHELAALGFSTKLIMGLQEVVWVNCGGKSSVCRDKNDVSWVARN